MGKQYCDQFSEMSDTELQQEFIHLAEQSLIEKQQIEREDNVNFTDFLMSYFSQRLDNTPS
jgi:hypothetical protein